MQNPGRRSEPPVSGQSEVQDLQDTIQQLQARIAELEAQLAALQRATSGNAARAVLQPSPSPEPKRVRQHRHRRWYKRLWRSLFPTGLSARAYLVIILVMIVLSILVGLWAVGQQ